MFKWLPKLLGVPSHMSKWEKASVQEHLGWIAKNHPVGLAIWDAQLKDPKWRTKEIWQTILRIRQGVDFNGTTNSNP